MKRQSLVFLFVIFFCANASYCQNTAKKCQKLLRALKTDKAISFRDSVLTFNNYYVEDNVLKNIKKSAYPLELRYYVSGSNRNLLDIYVLQSNVDSTKVTKFRTVTMDGSLEGFRVAKRLSLRSNLLVKEKSIITKDGLCDIYDLLFKNHFFEPGEKIPGAQSNIIAKGYGGDFFEVKLDKNFRNFEVQASTWKEEEMSAEEQSVMTVIKYLKNTIK